MAEMDWLCCQHMMLDGEMFYALMSDTAQLLPVEAECIVTPAGRVSDPMCINGAEVSAYNKARIYGWWVGRRNEFGTVENTKCDFVDVRNMLHVRLPARSDAIRGIPFMAPILASLIDYKEYREALRLKVKHEAKRSFNIVSESDEGPGNLGNRFGGTAGNETSDDPPQQGVTFENVNDLEIWHTRPGEKLDSMEMKNPGQYHVPFSETEAQEICGAVGLSWEWVRKIFSTSYIAGQASILSTQPTIERFQEAIESQKKRREWNWRIAKAMNDGDLPPAPTYKRGGVNVSEWFRCEWNWPPMLSLDRGKDNNADSQEWRNATASLTEQCRRKGSTFTHTLAMRKREGREILRAAGLPDTTPIPLWMLGPTPQNITPDAMAPSGEPDGDETTAQPVKKTK
jgi:capsid protein